MALTQITPEMIEADAVETAKILDANVTSAKIADNAITLAKMAGTAESGGADGELITFDTSGNPTYLGVGTSGQFLQTAGAGAEPVWANAITLGTAVTTTSGTAHTFGSLPSGTKQIIIMLDGVSLSTSAAIDLTLGDSGGLETTGYVGGILGANNSPTLTHDEAIAAFELSRATTGTMTGSCTLHLLKSSTNTWVANWNVYSPTSGSVTVSGAGSKSLSGELTQISLSGGTFNAGTVNIQYS